MMKQVIILVILLVISFAAF
ncbi:type I toxin-antitoxin system Ibs family toxin [Citrobacter portucalensis]|nr:MULTISPECIES: type I toxin-antitoxin system Ibs family toxin [Citrobacter freundii complex]ELT7645566.1 type I toxin-antitoxin system Ibs family toxin [Citrobacter freundii]MCO4136857.1 type I toxin-antitoxin system Ibs family toxin [Citrobacter portucalensis]MCO4153518.1 type I toxin-antitoxin system Ibs family toxin [Citrobacter portucalensis]MDV1269225.1 type I toxin-antitoxin system Ibs family toxin [Citrobacter freundii]MEB0409186.1 type I toxin-antitoxin system Ibs family toxin [Citro